MRWRRLPEKQLGYLAGIFDGEGCITVSLTSQNRLILRVSVQMTTPNEVRAFAKAFGGSVKKYSSSKEQVEWRPSYVWAEGNGAAVEILEFIVENCKLKAHAARPAFELAKDMRATPAGRAISAERKTWRLELAEQIVAAVGRRPEGFGSARVGRYLTGRTYSGKAVRASDGRVFASMDAAARVLGVTRTAICTAVRRNKPCGGLRWTYAVDGDGAPDRAAPRRAAFGAVLESLRRERDWTVSDLARLVGVTQQACSAWEHRETLPDLLNLARLCRLFGADGEALAAAYRGEALES